MRILNAVAQSRTTCYTWLHRALRKPTRTVIRSKLVIEKVLGGSCSATACLRRLDTNRWAHSLTPTCARPSAHLPYGSHVT